MNAQTHYLAVRNVAREQIIEREIARLAASQGRPSPLASTAKGPAR